MRITGLEPARVASLEPKSSASANFAISANKKSLWFLLGEGTRGGAITAFIHTLLFYVLFLKKSTVKTNLCKEKSQFLRLSVEMAFYEPGGIRTPDPRLRRPLLYPTELLIRIAKAGDENRTHVFSLEGWRSTIELHPQRKNEPGGIRTPDPRLRRPLLYPTELLIHVTSARDIMP